MISVIIPTYNRANYLSKAIDSLIGQSISQNDFEVIVVDDGSTDNTKKIVEQFQGQINLKYFHQNHGGVSRARNYGIEKSAGEIIVFFDDDAIADKNWLLKIAGIMKNENIITGQVKPIKNNLWPYFAPHYNQGNYPQPSPVLLEGNCAIAKKVFDEIGRFDVNLDYGHEGEEFIYRVGKKYKIMYYPEVIIYHDYAKGLISYCQKQIKFGQKKAYLVSRGFHREKNKLIKNNQINNLNLIQKLIIKIVARLGAFCHFWGYLSYKKY